MGTDESTSHYYINQIAEKSNYTTLSDDFTSLRVVRRENITPFFPKLTRQEAESFSVYCEYSNEFAESFIHKKTDDRTYEFVYNICQKT